MKKFTNAVFADDSVIRSDDYCSYIPALEGYTHEHRPYRPSQLAAHRHQ